MIARIRHRFAQTAVLRFWNDARSTANTMPKSRLRKLSAEARKLASTLNRFERHAQPLLRNSPARPLINDATWIHRVDLFADPISPRGHAPLTNATQISDTVTAFTDDPDAEIGFRQNTNPNGGFSAIFDVHHLAGSFFSLAIGLGPKVANTLSKSDLIRVRLDFRSEQEIEIHVRLNLRSGPNTEQTIVKFHAGHDVEFDLFYIDFDPKRMNDAWIDVLLPPQVGNRFELTELVVSKLPRAEI